MDLDVLFGLHLFLGLDILVLSLAFMTAFRVGAGGGWEGCVARAGFLRVRVGIVAFAFAVSFTLGRVIVG